MGFNVRLDGQFGKTLGEWLSILDFGKNVSFNALRLSLYFPGRRAAPKENNTDQDCHCCLKKSFH
jgi:hypothetical protein